MSKIVAVNLNDRDLHLELNRIPTGAQRTYLAPLNFAITFILNLTAQNVSRVSMELTS
jgi:hypothetical protein